MSKIIFLFLICFFRIVNTTQTNSLKKSKLFLAQDNFTIINNKEFDELRAQCFVNIKGIVYDISGLFDSSSDYNFHTGDNYFYFNFCKYALTKCKKDNTYIIYSNQSSMNNTTNECSLLSGTNTDNLPKWIISGFGEETSRLIITLPDGDNCQSDNTRTFYSTTYDLTCDKNIARLAIDNADEISPKKCRNVIKMRSKYACPNLNKYSFSNTIRKNSVLFGLILLVVGFYYCFYSYKYVQVTRVLTGVVTVCFLSFVVFANNIEMKFDSVNFWSVFILSVLIGLFLGYIISKYPWIVSAVLGGLLGFIFTELLYQLIASSLSWNPRAVYYIIFSISIGLGAFLGGFYQKHIFIVACAFIGSYSMIRGLGVLEDNFPHEQQLFDLIERSEWPQVYTMIDYKFYLYIVFSLIVGCIGACYQYKSYFKDIRDGPSDFFKTE